MPNRIIKESICTSKNIDQLTEFQEVFFYRLMVNCDDFGRFDARPKLLSSRLFPLRDVSTETVTETLAALQEADLIVVYEVNDHPYLQMKTWDKHQQARATKSKYPSFAECVLQSSDINCNQLQSDEISGTQPNEDDGKCPRNRIRNRNTISDNRNRYPREDDDAMIADEDANRIQTEQDKVLDAAEGAGFTKSDAVRAKLLNLYADHGLQKVLDGIDSCVVHGAANIAYLSAVLKGEPKKKPMTRAVSAQAYEQRNYDGEQEEAMKRMVSQMEAAHAG